MNTSKIAKVSAKFYEPGQKRYYAIEMENGDKGSISSEKENAYQVGQELKYKLTPQKDHPDKFWISEMKDKKFPQRNYKAEFAMKALECASRSTNVSSEVMSIADRYFDRLQKKSLSANQNG